MQYLHGNCIYSILPFAIGVASARYGLPKLSWRSSVIGCVLLWVSALDPWLWSVSALFFLMLIIPCIKISFVPFNKIMQWVGKNSAYIFVLHPIIRSLLIRGDAISELNLPQPINDVCWGVGFFIAMSLFMGWGYTGLFSKFPIYSIIGLSLACILVVACF